MGLILIRPQQEHEERLLQVLDHACADLPVERVIRAAGELEALLEEKALTGRRIMFALTTGAFGVNPGCMEMIGILREHAGGLENSVAGLIVDGREEWYTKALARDVIWSANQAGCWFTGSPLAEGTGSLYNYQILPARDHCSLFEAYLAQAAKVAARVMDFEKKSIAAPRVLVVHACDPATSNTFAAYRMIRETLAPHCRIREISLRSSSVQDCAGCSYAQCMHYSRNATCFYGGTITEEVYPALEECDALLLLCPNYNDALDAGLTAMINRLTSLFRKMPFYDKQIFAVVVSGYSGGDILCRQLIGALNINKSFLLPGRFCFTETAGAAGSIYQRPDLAGRTSRFAQHILACLQGAGL